MTKLGYCLFNILLVVLIYFPVYFFSAPGRQHDALMYTLQYFSGPYIGANFLMAVYSLVHWFVRQDHDVAAEGVLFLNATWISALLTFAAYEIINHGGLTKLF